MLLSTVKSQCKACGVSNVDMNNAKEKKFKGKKFKKKSKLL